MTGCRHAEDALIRERQRAERAERERDQAVQALDDLLDWQPTIMDERGGVHPQHAEAIKQARDVLDAIGKDTA